MKNEFRKRYYQNLYELVKDIIFILGRIPVILRNKRASGISSDFQERLMMVVTAVNGCRYCNNYHTGVALRMGFDREEVTSLLAGSIDNPDPDEATALLYAQHWAETNANPDSDYRKQLIDYYGKDRTRMIETILRMIRFGNLSGNSVDYIIYRLSKRRQ